MGDERTLAITKTKFEKSQLVLFFGNTFPYTMGAGADADGNGSIDLQEAVDILIEH